MAEQNKQIARRFLAAFAAADKATLEQIVAPDLVDHNPLPGQKTGRDGLIEAVTQYRTAFPDMKLTIENLMAEDELVAVTGKVVGTNQGSMMGAPATGKKVSFAYMDLYRIVHDRGVDVWHVEDIAGMLQQLGVVPGQPTG
jgi:steroid delta-isomerase-like uncharacterized protein